MRWVLKIPKLNEIRGRPLADLLAYGVITVASPIIYFYGGIKLLPIVLADCSGITQFLCIFLATWIFLGIGINLLLIRRRHSTIRAKVLSDPVIATEPVPIPNGAGDDGTNNSVGSTGHGLRQRNSSEFNNLGQQFLCAPFGSETAWHICSKCETYVPPRTWHCNTCKACVLRRDHHCVFAMSCIGLENHGNFLGLLFYLAAGTSYATYVLMIYAHKFLDEDITIPWLLFRSAMPLYVLFFDFSIHNLLTSFCFICSVVSIGVFAVYFVMSLTGETSGDRKRKQKGPNSNKKTCSYKNLKEFLGPKPILRIIWPFHSNLKF